MSKPTIHTKRSNAKPVNLGNKPLFCVRNGKDGEIIATPLHRVFDEFGNIKKKNSGKSRHAKPQAIVLNDDHKKTKKSTTVCRFYPNCKKGADCIYLHQATEITTKTVKSSVIAKDGVEYLLTTTIVTHSDGSKTTTTTEKPIAAATSSTIKCRYGNDCRRKDNGSCFYRHD